MTFDEARQKVVDAIKPIQNESVGEIVIVDDNTRTTPFGWVFFYDTYEYIETGDWIDALAGNAPYLADKFTGELHVTGTANPAEFYIAEYVARAYPDGFPDS